MHTIYMHSQLCKEKKKQHSAKMDNDFFQQLFHVLLSKENTSKLNICIDIGKRISDVPSLKLQK